MAFTTDCDGCLYGLLALPNNSARTAWVPWDTSALWRKDALVLSVMPGCGVGASPGYVACFAWAFLHSLRGTVPARGCRATLSELQLLFDVTLHGHGAALPRTLCYLCGVVLALILAALVDHAQ